MAKKNQDNKRTSMDDLAMQQFFKKLDDVERESRASDIGVVDDMYRYTGEEEQQQTAAPAPEGEATGNGKPTGEPVPEPPKGGPGGGASGGRPPGRRRGKASASTSGTSERNKRINLVGEEVPRIRLLLDVAKLGSGSGTYNSIILQYLEQCVSKDYPDLLKATEKQRKKAN